MNKKINKRKAIFFLSCVIFGVAQLAINIYAGMFFYYVLTDKIEQAMPLSVPDDLIFANGFEDTGLEWPPQEEHWSEELKQNPLVKIREDYCNRVGYKYADFGGDCFLYQYYNSFLTYTNEEENFEVYYPYLWDRDFEPAHYQFMAEPKLLLNRRRASCSLMYGLVDENKILSSGNASIDKVNFGNKGIGDVASMVNGLEKITIPFGRELTNEEKAAGYTNTKFIAVPHFPYSTSPYGFLMTSGEKQPLAEACVQEFDSILNSRMIINYPLAKLTNQSNGFISLRYNFSDFKSNFFQKIILTFENSVTGEEESIASEAFATLSRISSPFLSGGKLYYMHDQEGDNPKVKAINIFTGENETIPLPYDATRPVHSFFIKDSILYYLVGEFCNEYLAECKNMNLESYNLESGVNKKLISGSKSRDIDGFGANGDTLILSWKEGDAGCLWASYESYKFSDQTLNDLGSYSYCAYDEDDSSRDKDKFDDLIVGSGSFSYLIIKDGNIFSPRATDEYGARYYIRVNTTEYPFEE